MLVVPYITIHQEILLVKNYYYFAATIFADLLATFFNLV